MFNKKIKKEIVFLLNLKKEKDKGAGGLLNAVRFHYFLVNFSLFIIY